jgi:selenocysteine lyase/cysteine desulfurase
MAHYRLVEFSHTPTTYFMEASTTDATGLIEKVKNMLRQHYEPVHSPKDATLHYSTNEIYEQLQKLIPSLNYSSEDVAVWLHQAGFTFYDYGVLQFEWMMRKL